MSCKYLCIFQYQSKTQSEYCILNNAEEILSICWASQTSIFEGSNYCRANIRKSEFESYISALTSSIQYLVLENRVFVFLLILRQLVLSRAFP